MATTQRWPQGCLEGKGAVNRDDVEPAPPPKKHPSTRSQLSTRHWTTLTPEQQSWSWNETDESTSKSQMKKRYQKQGPQLPLWPRGMRAMAWPNWAGTRKTNPHDFLAIRERLCTICKLQKQKPPRGTTKQPAGSLESHLWCKGQNRVLPTCTKITSHPSQRRDEKRVKPESRMECECMSGRQNYTVDQGPKAWIRWSGMPLWAATVAAPMRKLWLEKLPETPASASISLRRAVRTARDRGWPSWKRREGHPSFPSLPSRPKQFGGRAEGSIPCQCGQSSLSEKGQSWRL